MNKVTLKYFLVAISLIGGTVAKANEVVISTFECSVPRRIGTTLEDADQEVSGTNVRIQKRQQGSEVYFVYMRNVYPSFNPVDQGVFKDIGVPYGRTKAGIISSIEGKNIFLASADVYDLADTNSVRVTMINTQDYSVCVANQSQ